MRTSLPTVLDHLRAHEGGYVNHPSDPGGCTNFGIALATYRRHVDARGTCSALRRMGWDTAAAIYEHVYWEAVEGDRLPAGIDLLVCDHGVNAGPLRARRLLQVALEVTADGVFGPVTRAALAAASPPALCDRYSALRLDYYRRLKTFATFGRGWTARVDAARAAAETLLIAAGKKKP